ncbi:MAG: response regulator [Acidobacteriota bacterium]
MSRAHEAGAPIRVLLVEDDSGFQLLIQRILERMDPPGKVVTAEDANGAMLQLSNGPFDLVLLDYSLPGRSGLEVLKDLRTENVRTPVVMVTGMGNETVAVDALKLGAYDYLVKSGDLKTALPIVVKRVIEKVQLEDGLRRFTEENERLRKLDRLKSQFIANVSHELRTPLVSVAGYAEMLASESLGPLTPDQKKALAVLCRNSERLKVLIDNILSLSSLEAHKAKPVKRPFDLAALARDRLLALSPACASRGIALAPLDGDGPVWAFGDPDLIEQVLWNLLSNAEKFTPEGGTIAVRLTQPAPSMITVHVTDTGCGIAPEHQPRIFDRFWQGQLGPTRPYPGLGIGLSIVKEILEAHDTSAQVESAVGRGTTFSFTLPSGSGAEPGAAVEVPARARAPRASGRTVLVVDDEADTREFIRTALEMASHKVLLCDGGKDALRTLRETTVDVILLDIAMKGQSGMDVLREIRGTPATARIPVLLLTAIADEGVRDEGLDRGADEVLEKPVRTSALLQAIERHRSPRPAAGQR